MFAILLIRDFLVATNHVSEIPYSEFKQRLDKGEVKDLVIGPTRITGSLSSAAGTKDQQHFTTVRVDPQVADDLARRGIAFSGQPEPGLFENFVSWLLPTAGFVLLWMFLLRPMMQGHGGLMGMGRSRAKIYAEPDVKVTFADVAGVDEAKQELAEIVGFLKDPKVHGRLGARIPKGVLLVGPPGTGKTLLARAVAGEAGVRFFSITGSEFVEMFVGVGAARVRDLFEQARAEAPAIVFIDELDALGGARGMGVPGGGHEEKEQTLNQLLAEMDGFDPRAGIVVLAATNRPEILDPALLRAGRFDRQVLVDRPDRKGRADILRVHLKKISVASDLDIDAVAALIPGFTGADIANLVNEAAMVATRRAAEATILSDFTQAIERIVIGIEKKSRILSPRERQIVANHEMGHTLVAMALPGTDPVQKVSIISRGLGALGYTMQRPVADRFLISRSELTSQMAVLMGGRAAESLVFDEVSTGAADDLARATDVARNMVTRFGMTPELGQVAYETETATFLSGQVPSWRPRSYGDGTAEEIDHTVQKLIEEAFTTARGILEQNRSILDGGARKLLELETLGPEQLAEVTAGLTRLTGVKSVATGVARVPPSLHPDLPVATDDTPLPFREK
ncbi:MAG: ATP-dependent zinc metalloprotease FtsH [Rhizobiales bacterium]|nr:ATP-dependent zinc metalloprotease FtsH [Hyphomicrobiales bacterium]